MIQANKSQVKNLKKIPTVNITFLPIEKSCIYSVAWKCSQPLKWYFLESQEIAKIRKKSVVLGCS